MKELISGTISSPLGFKTNALRCGIKKSEKDDLALIYSIVPAKAAAVFTTNKVKAAPLIVGKEHLRNNRAQAIIANSGNANCCTGRRGIQDVNKVSALVARKLDIPAADVLVSSNVVIGKFLPVEKIIAAVPELVNGLAFDKAQRAARAIMTTDTFEKQLAVEIKCKGKPVTIAAVAKGAGMICPDMATMLCFITTDACISVAALKKALRSAVDASFNRISVDGEMSTNDTAIILANGLAENAGITESGSDFKQFVAGLTHVCVRLAKMMVEDGEGASRVMQITVEGAGTQNEAKRAAGKIANSLLVKT
jgi:N-acetylglutamate synthase (EC 2.3.1.1)/glutamate N-acetyltransferase (EC 2.3.1.35)